MTRLADLRDAIVAVVVGSGLDVNAYAYETEKPALPAVEVLNPDLIDTRNLAGPGWRYLMPLRVSVPAGDAEAAQAALDALLDEDGGIVGALLADRTLGDEVDSADVVQVDQFGYGQIDGVGRYLSCVIQLEVLG